jgi:hypothetical protein
MNLKDKGPPGIKVIRLCERSMVARRFLQTFHIDEIAHAYSALWLEAESEEEKARLEKEYQKEIQLAITWTLGLHAGTGAVVEYSINHAPMISGGALLIFVIWSLRRKL